MKKVAIFDFDGTVVDSMDEFADIASAVIHKHYGLTVEAARKEYIKTSGLPFFEQLEVIFPGDKRNHVAAEEYETTKKKTYFDKKPFPEVKEAIEYLKNKNIFTVVSSNNFQDLVDIFAKGLSFSFDLVLGWKENFSKGKDHFEHVKKLRGCSKEEMVFVGDSLKDSDKAKNYGIDFIAKTGTFGKEDFNKYCPNAPVINKLTDLKNIL